MPPNRRKVKSAARKTALRMAMNVAGTFRERRKWPDLHYIDQVEPHIIEPHSPQSSSSFNTLGEFDFSDGKLQDTIDVLPPKKQAEIIPENWEVPNR